jgi:hypothetical protein
MYARSPAASAGRPRRCPRELRCHLTPRDKVVYDADLAHARARDNAVASERAHRDVFDAGGYPFAPLFIAIARFTGGRPLGAAVGDRWRDPGTRLAVAKSTSTAAGGPPCAPGSTPPLFFSPRQHG